MKSVPLTAYSRSFSRRTGLKKVRAQGRIPAVIYGRKVESQNLEVDLKELENIIHHSVTENLLVDLSVSNDPRPMRLVLVQEVQHHPLDGKVLHIDFHEVDPEEKVTVTVPVESVGEAVGVKTGGGVLEHVLFKLRVRALPRDLPEAILVDVSALEVGQSIHLGDIKPPEGVEILGEKHVSVLAVAEPITEAQEAEAAAAVTTGEVEMIKEKREEGEGAAPAKSAPAAKAAPAAKGAAEKAPDKKPAEKKK